MCELFAMSARFPTTASISLDELARHGGITASHRDGWGVAFVDEGDALVIREPDAASDSACLAFVREHQRPSTYVVAHIRKATQGARLLRNTQPFTRELWGRAQLFAHNGTVAGIESDPRFSARRFQPIGDTDSEHAFCALLERLALLGGADRGLPSLDARLAAVVAFAAELRTLGPANFLYCDGDVIFAHGHRRTNDAGIVVPPGLHVLCRACTEAERDDSPAMAELQIPRARDQQVALVASVPLSDEPWQPLVEGEVVVLREGRLVARQPPQGAGLGA